MHSEYYELRNLFVKELIFESKTMKCTQFFYTRTSNFRSEAERSNFFLRFEAENVLKTFLSYMSLV